MADDGAVPDPDRITDMADFIAALGRLRLAAGAPSYRTLAKWVGPLMPVPQTMSASTVIDVFKAHRRRLDFDLVAAIVRALGADDAEVARWRAACLRVHAEAKSGGSTGVFRQLPADLATFTGRERELALLLEAARTPVDSGAPTVVITAVEGMAGVGKTQLAVHAAHQLVREGHFTGFQLYVNLRGFDPLRPPAEPATVLEAFLRQLDVPAPHIPGTLEERAAMFRDRVDGRRALLLLDNAADEEQLRPLIPADPGCLVLITSRRSMLGLADARAQVLQPFSEDEGVRLLERIAGADRTAAHPEFARAVVERCGGLPLAVALVASRLRSRPMWSLADLDTRLAAGGLEQLGAGAVNQAIDLSYWHLSTAQQRMFRLLAAVPGNDFDTPLAAALADVSLAAADALLEGLLDAHLVQQHLPGRYRLHDLVAARARTVAAGAVREHRQALDRGLDYYLHGAVRAADRLAPGSALPDPPVTHTLPVLPSFAAFEEAMDWLEAERHNLRAAIDTAARESRHAHAWRLPQALWWFYCTRGYEDDWEAANHHARRAADALDDTRARGHVAKCAATAAWRHGHNEQAVALFDSALDLLREAADTDGEAAVENLLGNTYNTLGRLGDATEHYRNSADLYRKADNLQELYKPLGNIGLCLLAHGRYLDALAPLQENLTVIHERGIVAHEARALYHLGRAHTGLGDHAEGLARYRQAVVAARRSGDRLIEALALSGAALHQHDHDGPQSLRDHEHALALIREAGNVEASATVLNRYAASLGHLGRPDEAREHYRRALSIAEQAHTRMEEAIACLGLAQLLAPGDPRGARDQSARAAGILAEMGLPPGTRHAV